ncbi:DUF63 family protein [Halorarum halophilum]|uniref:DUF63 family protein n=1 Tax=Halorarum halophilum TaxID=2743090 RepID=A0A7D5GIN5_9EURY|nr:DUF63 family protein [Halobaculum halophilum]QLG26307.1 DUF63 family protein [Halobaculum halophilum]
MALLPEGFALPPLPHLLLLALALGGVAYALRERAPSFRTRHVIALVPWMCAGAAGHVLFVLGEFPPVLAPLFGTPSAYLTTAAVAGGVWLASLASDADDAVVLGAAGTLAFLVVGGRTLAYGAAAGSLTPWLPAAGFVGGALLGVAVAMLLYRVHDAASVAGVAGVVAVAAHGVDGVTTAVGVDLLGFGERTPLSRLIIEFAHTLPTAGVLGGGWLFVLVKLVVGAVVVAAIAPTVRDAPTEGNVLLALVTAVGLGPGVHNVLLFAVAAP